MFILTESRHTPIPKRQIREAFPDVECSVPDICILNASNATAAILLNSKMLREALLTNPEMTKNLLGIIVTDVNAPQEKKVIKKSTKPRVALNKIDSPEIKED